MANPLISTVILNTNRKNDTLEAIGSLFSNTYENQQIIVLDNHSTDGSVQAVRTQFPQVQIIELKENLGYAGNNNVGIEAACKTEAEWILVLNEDTVLAPDCLEQLIRVAESDETIGILGPMVYHHNEPQVIQSAGGELGKYWQSTHVAQNEVDRGQFPDPRPVEWVSGCAIMVRKSIIDQVGALDPRFFYYWEETEWCLRAHRAGWRIVHVPQAKLWHKGVQRDYHPGPNVTYYNTRNRFMLFAKHKAPLFIWMRAWLETLRTLISWSVKPHWRDHHEHRDAMLQGILDYLRGRVGMRSPKST